MTHLISVIYIDDENYEFSGYPDGMYDEEDEIGTGYLDDDFEEKNTSKRDRDRNAYDDKDDLEMVYYALIRTSTPSQRFPFLFCSILSVSNSCNPPSPLLPSRSSFLIFLPSFPSYLLQCSFQSSWRGGLGSHSANKTADDSRQFSSLPEAADDDNDGFNIEEEGR
jgi:hypothetical protein